MRLRKIRLQSQRLIRGNTRFLSPWRCRVEGMIRPTFHHGETGKSSGEVWIELRCLFEKLLGLQRGVAEHTWPGGIVVRLDEEQICIWILRRSAIESCFFVWGKFCLQR